MLGLFSKETINTIHVNDIDGLIGSIELIDIREPYEYQSGSIKTAKNIPMGTLLNNPEKYLIKNKTYHIICQSGGRSRNACSTLVKMGYDVVNVAGGVGSYVGSKRK